MKRVPLDLFRRLPASWQDTVRWRVSTGKPFTRADLAALERAAGGRSGGKRKPSRSTRYARR